MTREEFIKELKEKRYSHKIEGDKIVVTHDRNVWLNSLSSLPPDVEFRNRGDVWLESLINVGFISRWQGNIEGIDSNRLLNKMIELGLFDRR